MKKTRSIAVKSRPSRQRTKRGKCLHWTEESMPAAQCRRRSAADRVGTYCQQQWSTDGDRDTCYRICLHRPRFTILHLKSLLVNAYVQYKTANHKVQSYY